jgi:hypothetical protein
MSKKELLNETQIRRFMTLANLEPLVKNVISEEKAESQKEREGDVPNRKGHLAKSESVKEEVTNEAEETEADESDEMDVEMDSGDADPDKAAAFEAAVKALADSLGIEVEVGGDEGGEEGGDVGGEEAPDMDMPDAGGEQEMEEGKNKEEEMDEAKDKEEMDEAKDKDKEEEMDESVALSEDSLVEAVLARVTARLVAEAKKKKMSAKEKMKAKKAEKKDKEKVMEEATDSKGGGPLLKQGKNKHDTYKGHADMAYAKGKEGKGGHQMETLNAKAEHTVTHGGKNLATLGGNKKKV